MSERKMLGYNIYLHIYAASVWMWNFKFGGQKLVRFWQQIYDQHIQRKEH